MNEEDLSALLDGECSPAELDRLLDEMDRSPALKARYSRMCLVRDSVQGLRLRASHLGLAERVQAALAADQAFRPSRMRAVRWPAVAGLALAAGLAAVVVLVVRPDRVPETTVAAAQTAPAAATSVAERDPAWRQLQAEDAQELNTYMVAHSRSRAQMGQGMGGTLGYARYTAYSAELQQQAPAKH